MPFEITLVQTALETAIVAFDGRILEIFNTLWESRTHRYHVTMLSEFRIKTDKQGLRTLAIKVKAGFNESFSVDNNRLPAVQTLVAQVQQAMTEYR